MPKSVVHSMFQKFIWEILQSGIWVHNSFLLGKKHNSSLSVAVDDNNHSIYASSCYRRRKIILTEAEIEEDNANKKM